MWGFETELLNLANAPSIRDYLKSWPRRCRFDGGYRRSSYPCDTPSSSEDFFRVDLDQICIGICVSSDAEVSGPQDMADLQEG